MSFNEFQTVCADSIKCAAAFRIYVDLLKDEQVLNLEKTYDADLDEIYLRCIRDASEVVIVPMLNTQDLSFWQLEAIQSKLGNSFILAICDTSSNVLYYPISSGFKEK